MKTRPLFIAAFLILILSLNNSCRLLFPEDDEPSVPKEEPEYEIDLDELEVRIPDQFQGKKDRNFNLIHTLLDLHPDWEQKELRGSATLTLTPHFYQQDSLTLDAKGFSINNVRLLTDTFRLPLRYQYDQRQLQIALPKSLTAEDTFEVVIDYKAHPYDDDKWPNHVNRRDRGLHFVLPDEHFSHLPRQVWTQGQPESASSWFPTIDAPYQRSTQELFITVDDDLKTLSNGTHLYSTRNADGTRTDYWEQRIPHAPYLFMMAAGDFAVVEDRHEELSLDIHYFLEESHKEYAKDIFGKTPEMIEFFSDLTQIEYPWDKYHQIIVRDFMAGAMENTGAVVYFEEILRNPHELIDKDFEHFIAHEAAHHWFGNITSTSSWSELFINEGPATYSAYLWKEKSYSDAYAQYYLKGEWEKYQQVADDNRSIVNNYFVHPYENFNRHNYQKAALVLHYLRNMLGDEAFFSGLNHFLIENAFDGADRHQFRRAFEEVSGKDLELFFNQWFEEPGHPEISTERIYNESNGRHGVVVSQNQDLEIAPLYKLPYMLRIYNEDTFRDVRSELSYKTDTVYFKNGEDPDFVEWDPEYVIPAERVEEKTVEECVVQFQKSSHIRAKLEALSSLADNAGDTETDTLTMIAEEAIEHDFFAIRKAAIEQFFPLYRNDKIEGFGSKVVDMIASDEHHEVRKAAIENLHNESNHSLNILEERLDNDSSYAVKASALIGIFQADSARGVELAQNYQSTHNDNLLLAVGNIFSKAADPEFAGFFADAQPRMLLPARYTMYLYYANFLAVQENPGMIADHLEYWDIHIQRALDYKLGLKNDHLRSGLRRMNNRIGQTIEYKKQKREEYDEDSDEHERLTMVIYRFNEIEDQLSKLIRKAV